VALSSVITDRFPLAEAAQAFRVAAPRRGLKMIVEPVRSCGRADPRSLIAADEGRREEHLRGFSLASSGRGCHH